MALNPTRCRTFSTGGSNSKPFYLNRDGANLTVISAENSGRTEHVLPTVAEAKRVMANPAILIK